MPQPTEQKLQAVVYSLTPCSFSFFAAACASGMHTSSPSARPAPPPAASFIQDLRVRLICSLSLPAALAAVAIRFTPGV